MLLKVFERWRMTEGIMKWRRCPLVYKSVLNKRNTYEKHSWRSYLMITLKIPDRIHFHWSYSLTSCNFAYKNWPTLDFLGIFRSVTLNGYFVIVTNCKCNQRHSLLNWTTVMKKWNEDFLLKEFNNKVAQSW